MRARATSHLTFSVPVSVPAGAGPRHLVIADLTGNGHPDLVVANAESSDVSVLFGDGAGGFVGRRLAGEHAR